MPKKWAILVVVMFLFACGCHTMKDTTNVKTVNDNIRAHLPIGSSKDDVVAYLDQRAIPHSWLKPGELSPDGTFLIPNSHTERGVIRDVRSDGVVSTSIQIDFKFDDSDSKLVNFTVQEVFRGP